MKTHEYIEPTDFDIEDWLDYMTDTRVREISTKTKNLIPLLSIIELKLSGGYESLKKRNLAELLKQELHYDMCYLISESIQFLIDSKRKDSIMQKWDRYDFLQNDIQELRNINSKYFSWAINY